MFCIGAKSATMGVSRRHFETLATIRRIIDSLTYAKLNVLHWHISDSQSFPLESKTYPKLWAGAFSPQERYVQADVADIVEYARARGVRVMVEFDQPGHAASWCAGYPEVCPSTTCTQPLNPATEKTFDLITSRSMFLSSSNPCFALRRDFAHLRCRATCQSKSRQPSCASFPATIKQNKQSKINKRTKYTTNTRFHTRIHSHIHPLTRTCTPSYTNAYMRTRTRTHTLPPTHTYLCPNCGTQTHTHTTHTCAHTHVRTRTYAPTITRSHARTHARTHTPAITALCHGSDVNLTTWGDPSGL
jgi:hypothetical protein